ncbi:hypothetical protein CY34DRAFT_19386 [Suillus luteus UH-Slu-Lm8-n1]|uniref:Unplaced genomic scaffold CY34scaffold_1353, whole genome shotgun sequence n=1 Tax=Suillus luteus UH-Slu-Lm8-n1 TaxID=930992 RepID=A0A0D0A1I0_9AGAM|nr:hypothetical protein CY34DRAFT_19386 [Suillus luteus UH-Slu-Lm8-n1]
MRSAARPQSRSISYLFSIHCFTLNAVSALNFSGRGNIYGVNTNTISPRLIVATFSSAQRWSSTNQSISTILPCSRPGYF